jgi:hypothetical protein
MSNQTPAPNDDVPRTPSAEDAIRNDYGIDPQNDPVASENDVAHSETESAEDSDEESDPSTAKGNRYSPDNIEPESQAERTEGKPTDADVDTDGG